MIGVSAVLAASSPHGGEQQRDSHYAAVQRGLRRLAFQRRQRTTGGAVTASLRTLSVCW